MSSRLDPRPRSDGQLDRRVPVEAPDSRFRILILYVVSGCDCRCAMCSIWRDGRGLAMEPESIAAEIDAWRAAGLERIVLSGGEPLRHPRLAALLGALACTPCTLLTSGMTLEAQAPLLAEGPVDDVIVSLDGPPDLHNRIRGRADAYARVERGVARLRSLAPHLRISARCTVQRANVHALRQTVDSARALGLAGISFLAVDAHSQAFNRSELPDAVSGDHGPAAGLLPDAQGLSDLEQELAALFASHGEAFAKGFIAESPAKLRRRLLEHFRAELGLGPRPGVGCNAPWVSAVVEADGQVRPCFFHAPTGRWQPGTRDLLTSWLEPEAAAFRAGLDVASHPLCQRCVCNLNLR